MKLSDLSTGPDWISYAGFALLMIFAIILFSGHGSNLIAGYNTMPREKKEQYNEKKLGKVVGVGVGIIAVLVFIMGLFEKVFPSYIAYVSVGIAWADIAVVIVLCNTICKKRDK